MRNTLLMVPGIILALNSAVPAWAQRPDGFQLTSPLSLSAGYDENFAVGSQELDDTVTLLTLPTLSWTRNTHRTDFSIEYEPEFELFSHNQNLNAWNHSAALRLTHRINGRLTLEAGDSFLSTMDPSRQLVDSLLLLPRGRFQQNVFYTGLSYRLDGRTTLSVRFDNATVTTALPGALANGLDQMSNAGTVTLERTVNRHHTLSGGYSYLLVHPLNTGNSGNSIGMHNFNSGYIYTLNPGLIFRFSGGMIRGQQSSFTGGGAVEKRLSGLWVAAGFERYLSFFGGLAPTGAAPAGAIPFPNGLEAGNIYQVASLRAWGKLTKRIGLEGSVLRGLDGVSPQNRPIKSVVGQFRLDYKLSERLTLFTRVEFYGQNINDFSQLPLSRKRYFGGLEIALSHHREPAKGAREAIEGTADAADSVDSGEPQGDESHRHEDR
ncbi:MAG TPA: hypothetical protein VFF64_25505 [Candidatus Eremiobacteraceae bacterium]|nr:hypothetical protein [Candidatus Eremiobacteraceae bacterium]